MKKIARDHQEYLLEALKDPDEAAAYLNAALEEKDGELFLIALRNVVEAHGMAKIARKAKLNRENMYRMLSEHGNPEFSSLWSLVNSLGFRLSVTPA
ncbi:MAG: putative addiction module antidote protein [Candidatus Riflebacteria bacterium]|nr:putative addiction module antidote protein [Candidatus Riflebacteria bacterium]